MGRAGHHEQHRPAAGGGPAGPGHPLGRRDRRSLPAALGAADRRRTPRGHHRPVLGHPHPRDCRRPPARHGRGAARRSRRAVGGAGPGGGVGGSPDPRPGRGDARPLRGLHRRGAGGGRCRDDPAGGGRARGHQGPGRPRGTAGPGEWRGGRRLGHGGQPRLGAGGRPQDRRERGAPGRGRHARPAGDLPGGHRRRRAGSPRAQRLRAPGVSRHRQGRPRHARAARPPAHTGTGLGPRAGGAGRRHHVRLGGRGPGQPGVRTLPRAPQLPAAVRRPPGDRMTTTIDYTPGDIAEALGQHVPTPEQQAVIEAPLAPQLVVAGAGSGKTETMSARVVYLVATGQVRADQVLGLTFTRKAAAELSDRVRTRLRQLRRTGLLDTHQAATGGLEVDRPTIATYNSFAADIAKEHALRIGMDPDARLVTEAGAWQIADAVVQGWHASLDVDASPSVVTDAVLSLSGALAEHLLTVDEARDQLEDLADSLLAADPAPRAKAPYADTRKVVTALRERAALLDLVAAYARAKRERGVMDFADQVAMAARIAETVPTVGQALREQYPLVLLDEYQDTSVAQLRLLSAVFGDGHAVTAVGDPNQAIYGWRGAAAAALADFPAQFPSLGRAGQQATPTRYLRTSWRNDARILAVANRISAPLRQAAAVEVPELAARPGAGAGHVTAGYPTTMAEEVEGVAEFLAERWDPATTAAVLCRARSQFPAVVEALRARDIPVEVLGLEIGRAHV